MPVCFLKLFSNFQCKSIFWDFFSQFISPLFINKYLFRKIYIFFTLILFKWGKIFSDLIFTNDMSVGYLKLRDDWFSSIIFLSCGIWVAQHLPDSLLLADINILFHKQWSIWNATLLSWHWLLWGSLISLFDLMDFSHRDYTSQTTRQAYCQFTALLAFVIFWIWVHVNSWDWRNRKGTVFSYLPKATLCQQAWVGIGRGSLS